MCIRPTDPPLQMQMMDVTPEVCICVMHIRDDPVSKSAVRGDRSDGRAAALQPRHDRGHVRVDRRPVPRLVADDAEHARLAHRARPGEASGPVLETATCERGNVAALVRQFREVTPLVRCTRLRLPRLPVVSRVEEAHDLTLGERVVEEETCRRARSPCRSRSRRTRRTPSGRGRRPPAARPGSRPPAGTRGGRGFVRRTRIAC